MNNVIPFDETKPLRVRPVILGALTTLTLLGTFILDIGTADEVVTWVPYCWLPTFFVPCALLGHILVFRALQPKQN